MAHPVYTFINIKSNKRCFQIWNTVRAKAETIPMDLLTLLQLKGIYNKEFIYALHISYNKLIVSGSTIENDNFGYVNSYFKNQIFDSIATLDCNLANETIKISEQLSDLFFEQRDFKIFYEKYLNFVKKINPATPYPNQYYKSWAYTDEIFELIPVQGRFIIEKHLKNYKEKKLDHWIALNYFETEYQLLLELFYELAENNYIEISSIPHVFRHESSIKKLYKAYAMDNLLPDFIPKYDFTVASNFKLYESNDIKHSLQFLNYCAFDGFGQHIWGKRLHEIPSAKIDEIFAECNTIGQIVNFKDQYGNIRNPFIYTLFDLNFRKGKFVFLWLYGSQSTSVFLKDGELIDEGNYYDTYAMKKNAYLVASSDYQNVIKGIYDFKTKTLAKYLVTPQSAISIVNVVLPDIKTFYEITLDVPLKKETFMEVDSLDDTQMKNIFCNSKKSFEEDDLPF